MYDVNSGGVQPCDTFLSTRKAPISISGTHVVSGSPHAARPSIVRPGRSAAAPVRLRRARPGDPGGGPRTVPRHRHGHRSAPASALAARGNPESPRSISTRCGAFILSRD